MPDSLLIELRLTSQNIQNVTSPYSDLLGLTRGKCILKLQLNTYTYMTVILLAPLDAAIQRGYRQLLQAVYSAEVRYRLILPRQRFPICQESTEGTGAVASNLIPARSTLQLGSVTTALSTKPLGSLGGLDSLT